MVLAESWEKVIILALGTKTSSCWSNWGISSTASNLDLIDSKYISSCDKVNYFVPWAINEFRDLYSIGIILNIQQNAYYFY